MTSVGSASRACPATSARVLVATDCLRRHQSSGTLHGRSALRPPWNPNRLEQREGRVDRFGQQAAEVKACLLYGADNPIDGIVLDVLLRKVREIKRATGINVPFPEDSQSIIDTITQALLLNPDRRIEKKRGDGGQQMLSIYDSFEAAAAKNRVTRKVDEAAGREIASRSIFAQYTPSRPTRSKRTSVRSMKPSATPKRCRTSSLRRSQTSSASRSSQKAKASASFLATCRSNWLDLLPAVKPRPQSHQGQLRIAHAGGLPLPRPQPPLRRAALPVRHGQHPCPPRQARRPQRCNPHPTGRARKRRCCSSAAVM
jgi:hypothetical protein